MASGRPADNRDERGPVSDVETSSAESLVKSPPPRLSGSALALIFATALVLRGIVVLELAQAPFFSTPIGDSLGYHLWAERLAGGDWIGSEIFYQAPFYPYLLGVLYSVTGANPLWAKLAQIVLESFSCVLLAGAGARFFASPRVGLWAGFLATAYAPAIFFTTLLQKATLSFFLTSAALNLLSHIQRSERSSFRLAMLGLVLGLLALTRENALIFIILVLVWLVVRVRAFPRRKAAAWIALFVLGVGLPLASVGLRNSIVGGDFTLTTSQFGTNFFIGNNANAKGFYLPLRFFRGNVKHERDDAVEMAEEALGRTLSPGEVSAFWTGKTFEYIREQPIDWLALMTRKALLVFNRVEAADTEDIAAYRDFSIGLDTLARVFHFGILLPLAVAGLSLSRRRWRDLWLLYAMIGFYAASLTLFFLFARYRIPLIPPILLFAAVGIEELRDVFRRSDRAALIRTGLFAGAAVVVTNLPLTDTDTQLAASYKNFAAVMIEREDFSKAVAYFERSIEIRPDVAGTHQGRAEALADLGRLEEARTSYERLLVLDPESFPGHVGLGRLQLAESEFEAGIASLEQAARLKPRMIQPLLFLAEHYDGQGQLVRARRAYRAVLVRAPENRRARAQLARIATESKRRGDAQPLKPVRQEP